MATSRSSEAFGLLTNHYWRREKKLEKDRREKLETSQNFVRNNSLPGYTTRSYLVKLFCEPEKNPRFSAILNQEGQLASNVASKVDDTIRRHHRAMTKEYKEKIAKGADPTATHIPSSDSFKKFIKEILDLLLPVTPERVRPHLQTIFNEFYPRVPRADEKARIKEILNAYLPDQSNIYDDLFSHATDDVRIKEILNSYSPEILDSYSPQRLSNFYDDLFSGAYARPISADKVAEKFDKQRQDAFRKAQTAGKKFSDIDDFCKKDNFISNSQVLEIFNYIYGLEKYVQNRIARGPSRTGHYVFPFSNFNAYLAGGAEEKTKSRVRPSHATVMTGNNTPRSIQTQALSPPVAAQAPSQPSPIEGQVNTPVGNGTLDLAKVPAGNTTVPGAAATPRLSPSHTPSPRNPRPKTPGGTKSTTRKNPFSSSADGAKAAATYAASAARRKEERKSAGLPTGTAAAVAAAVAAAAANTVTSAAALSAPSLATSTSASAQTPRSRLLSPADAHLIPPTLKRDHSGDRPSSPTLASTATTTIPAPAIQAAAVAAVANTSMTVTTVAATSAPANATSPVLTAADSATTVSALPVVAAVTLTTPSTIATAVAAGAVVPTLPPLNLSLLPEAAAGTIPPPRALPPSPRTPRTHDEKHVNTTETTATAKTEATNPALEVPPSPRQENTVSGSAAAPQRLITIPKKDVAPPTYWSMFKFKRIIPGVWTLILDAVLYAPGAGTCWLMYDSYDYAKNFFNNFSKHPVRTIFGAIPVALSVVVGGILKYTGLGHIVAAICLGVRAGMEKIGDGLEALWECFKDGLRCCFKSNKTPVHRLHPASANDVEMSRVASADRYAVPAGSGPSVAPFNRQPGTGSPLLRQASRVEVGSAGSNTAVVMRDPGQSQLFIRRQESKSKLSHAQGKTDSPQMRPVNPGTTTAMVAAATSAKVASPQLTAAAAPALASPQGTPQQNTQRIVITTPSAPSTPAIGPVAAPSTSAATTASVATDSSNSITTNAAATTPAPAASAPRAGAGRNIMQKLQTIMDRDSESSSERSSQKSPNRNSTSPTPRGASSALTSARGSGGNSARGSAKLAPLGKANSLFRLLAGREGSAGVDAPANNSTTAAAQPAATANSGDITARGPRRRDGLLSHKREASLAGLAGVPTSPPPPAADAAAATTTAQARASLN